MARVYMVRHGETASNSAWRYWGATDVELSDDGVKQAERIRDRLKSEHFDVINSSDLKRALVTAKVVASSDNATVVTHDELREINFGDLEGLTFDEISQRYPEIVQLWIKKSPELRYPNGESIEEFSTRLHTFADRLGEYTPEQKVLVVAHSGVLRVLICHLLGLDIQCWRSLYLDFASISIVDIHGSGGILSLLNDTSHLEVKRE